jgi:cytochrome c-type biogenesis protein CcmH
MRAARAGWLCGLVLAIGLANLSAVYAVQPDEMLANPALEARARELSRELRCMVCQNQSIDDSDAPLARDLRLLVRERLKAGDSDAQVLDFLTARYGQFVLLKPRFGWDTALLWLAPAGVLVVGTVALVALLRRRRGTSAGAESEPPPLTDAEQSRLAELTGEPRPSSGQAS